MNEIHQALVSLGPIIATTVHSLRAKGQAELSPAETQDSSRKYRTHCSPGPLIATTVHSLKAQEPEDSCPVETREAEEKCRIKRSPCPLIATTVYSLKAQEPEDLCPVETRESEEKCRIKRSPCPLIATTVHSLRAQVQEELCPVETRESEEKCRIKRSPSRSAGFPFLNTATHLTEGDPGSVFSDHLGAGASEGEIKRSPECEVGSFRIKDEIETFGSDPPDETHIERLIRPRDNRSMNSSAVNNKILSCKSLQVEIHQNSEKETTSKSRTWLQRNPDPCKSVFSCSTHTKLHQATSLTDRPPTYLGYESAVKNAGYFASLGKLKHWNQFAYTERELSIYQRDVPAAPQIPDNDTPTHPFSEHEQSFFSKKDLFIPHKTYSGETQHQCVECGKTFNKNTCLVRHKRIHTGERPFQCSECGKSFNRKEVLSRHKMIHTGEKPYQCAQCGKTFIQKTDLVRHQKVH
ncbi:uncharacterized protein LOC144770914 isoform X2 [Lissotriton helveticus]